MEPTIYKPSIYKGAGIYKTGAEGGGGGASLPFDVDFSRIDFSVSNPEYNGVIFYQKQCRFNGVSLCVGSDYSNNSPFFKLEHITHQLGEWTKIEVIVNRVDVNNYRYILPAMQGFTVGNESLFSNYATWAGKDPNVGTQTIYKGSYNYSGVYDDLIFTRNQGISTTYPLKIVVELDRQNNILTTFWNDEKIIETGNSYNDNSLFDSISIEVDQSGAPQDTIVIDKIKIS